MPHVIVKLWQGKSEAQKQKLADAITDSVMQILSYGEESVSVSFEEVEAARWRDEVYVPDILGQPEKLYKEPGYRM